MSSTLDLTVCDVDERIAILNNFESKLSIHFNASNKDVKNKVEEVKAAIKSLKNALTREKVETVVELIKKGEFENAKKEVQLKFPNMKLGTLEEIILLSYSDVDNLKNTIKFLEHIDDAKLKARGYRAVYQEIKFKKHTERVEILLLHGEIKKLQDKGQDIQILRNELNEDRKRIMSLVVEEIGKDSCPMTIDICKIGNITIFHEIISEIVPNYFESSNESMMKYVNYKGKLPYIENSCALVDSLYKELEKRNMLESEQALHLWSSARNIANESNFKNVESQQAGLCTKVINALSERKSTLLVIYRDICIGDFNKDAVKRLHSRNNNLHTVIPDFVEFYYNGEPDKASNLVTVSNSISIYKPQGSMLFSLFEQMEKKSLHTTFEAFKVFNELKRLTNFSTYDAQALWAKELEAVKKKAPKCVSDLFWGGTEKCRIVNKYYDEPLFCATKDQKVFTWIPQQWNENQFWEFNVDETTALVSFLHVDLDQHLATKKRKESYLDAVIGNTELGWKMKAAENEYFKIYTTEDEFMTAGEPSSDANCRTIYMKSENDTDMQLWKIELVM